MSPSGTPSVGSNQPGDDEVIPTAIVIKNIPFNVKRETLLDIIVSIIVSAAQPRKKILADMQSRYNSGLLY